MVNLGEERTWSDRGGTGAPEPLAKGRAESSRLVTESGRKVGQERLHRKIKVRPIRVDPMFESRARLINSGSSRKERRSVTEGGQRKAEERTPFLPEKWVILAI
jgi:hypothetical protein